MRGQGGSSLRRAAWGRMRGGGGDDDSDLLGLSLDERMDGRGGGQTDREGTKGRTEGRMKKAMSRLAWPMDLSFLSRAHLIRYYPPSRQSSVQYRPSSLRCAITVEERGA